MPNDIANNMADTIHQLEKELKELREENINIKNDNERLRDCVDSCVLNGELDYAELAEAKRLLKAAVEGMHWLNENTQDSYGSCTIRTEHGCSGCPFDINSDLFCKRKHEAEALALIGEDANVGHKSGGWISCKDEMPEDNTSVLFVYVSENGIKSVHYGHHQTVRGLGSSWGEISGGWRYCNDDVTHWMPIPEPPKDGDTNG